MTSAPGTPSKRRLLLIGSLAAALLAAIVAGGWWTWQRAATPLTAKPVAVRIALPSQISAGAFFVGMDQQLFARQSLDLQPQKFLLGKDAMQAVLDGKADLAVLADTPFMFSVMRGDKIATVSVIYGSRKTMSVVARRDRNIQTARDLQGKTIGTVFGTNNQYFLDTLLLTNGVPDDQVNVVDVKPDELIASLRDGRLDAITGWQPEHHKALGDGATIMYSEDVFVFRFLLAGRQDYIDSHPEEIRRVLAGLDASIRFIQQKPAEGKTIIGRSLGMNPAELSHFYDPKDFSLSLNQTLLLALGDQTRWSMNKGLAPMAAVPDYRDHIRSAPLEAVLPSAVKIIR